MDYTTVTEVPGNLVTADAINMLWTRYAFAAAVCEGKDVVEVACGPGSGLTHLLSKARRVVGADYTHDLLRIARGHTAGRVALLRIDAQAMPFRSNAFDVVLLFEAIYYIPDALRFIREAHRVLRPGGCLVIASDNPAFPDFNPSPYSHHYFNSEELRSMLTSAGFDASVQGCFAASRRSVPQRLVSMVKRTAVTLRLVPKTMRGKEYLKRIFYGTLHPFPAELTERAGAYDPPLPVAAGNPSSDFRLLFAIGRRR